MSLTDPNPKARLEHLANLGSNVGELLEIVTTTSEVHSHFNPLLFNSIESSDVRFFTLLLRMID